MGMVKVRYIGNKGRATDTVSHSGAVWNGRGDVQEVTDEQWKLLRKYEGNWELADEAKKPAKASRSKPQKPETFELESSDGKVIDLAQMGQIELVEFVKASGALSAAVDLKLEGDDLRRAIVEAVHIASGG